MASMGKSAVSGAAAGASAGTAVSPGWGTVIGGAIGLIGGGILGLVDDMNEEDAKEKAREALQSGKISTMAEYNSIINQIDEYYKNRGSLGTKDDVQSYKDIIEDYNPEDSVYNFKEYGYNKQVSDFLNPYYDTIIADTSDAVQHSAAGAGLGRGSGAAESIATAVAKKSDELYKTALQQYNTDRNFDYQKYNDYIKNMQNKLDTINQNKQWAANQYKDLASDYYATMDSQEAAKIAAKQDKLAAQTSYDQAIASIGY